MKMSLKAVLPVAIMLAGATAGHTQAMAAGKDNGPYYKWHHMDVGIAAAGQYTTSVTNQEIGGAGEILPHQGTTDSPGALFTIRMQPKPWAGLEFNYQYTKFSENFVRAPRAQGPVYIPNLNAPVNVATSFHEATGAYVLHLKPRKRISPYVGIGGGYIDFVPTQVDSNQWRGTGLFDVGFDMQTESRLGFRIGARDLVYRAPDYFDGSLSSSRWVSTEEPYAGVYVKF